MRLLKLWDCIIVFQVFEVCMKADPKDEKALKLAEKLGVKLTSEEKELAGKQLLKVHYTL